MVRNIDRLPRGESAILLEHLALLSPLVPPHHRHCQFIGEQKGIEL